MRRYKGVVKNNRVELDGNVQLPEGTKVEVRLSAKRKKRKEAIARVLGNPITRPIGIDEIIEEVKRDWA
jgi:hypothetical protein